MIKFKMLLVLLGLSLVVLGAWVTGWALTSVTYYPAGRDIVYDDFGFTAERATSATRLGTVQAPSGQAFYIVEAKVTNFAKRVDFDFKPEIVKLYTVNGKPCPNAMDAQSAIDTQLGKAQMTNVSLSPGGDFASRQIAFVGPAGLTEVRVAFSSAGAIGDFLDAIFGGNINVKLPVK